MFSYGRGTPVMAVSVFLNTKITLTQNILQNVEPLTLLT